VSSISWDIESASRFAPHAEGAGFSIRALGSISRFRAAELHLAGTSGTPVMGEERRA